MNNMNRLTKIPGLSGIFFLIMFLFMIPSSLWAATIYVSPAGGGDGTPRDSNHFCKQP